MKQNAVELVLQFGNPLRELIMLYFRIIFGIIRCENKRNRRSNDAQ